MVNSTEDPTVEPPTRYHVMQYLVDLQHVRDWLARDYYSGVVEGVQYVTQPYHHWVHVGHQPRTYEEVLKESGVDLIGRWVPAINGDKYHVTEVQESELCNDRDIITLVIDVALEPGYADTIVLFTGVPAYVFMARTSEGADFDGPAAFVSDTVFMSIMQS